MANISRANGFRPVMHLNGSPYNGQFNRYTCPAAEVTAIGIGDFVIASSKPILAPATGPGVESIGTGSVTGGPIVGVVVGKEVILADGNVSGGTGPVLDNPQYKAASTLAYVYVADSPDLLFEGQEDGVSGAFTLAMTGYNVAIQGGAASTVTGRSIQMLDSSVAAVSTSTYPLQLVKMVSRPDNEIGAYCRWLVRINVHTYGNAGAIAAVAKD